MRLFEANITWEISDFLNKSLKGIFSFEIANKKIYDAFKILHFLESNEELKALKNSISLKSNMVSEPDRSEYGDFQTNADLVNKTALYLASKGISPSILIEPTCGKGNFIIASLKNFKSVKDIIAIEIYKPYIWECKFNIMNFYLENPKVDKPDISIVHCSVFDFDFTQIFKKYTKEEILVIGNPPWVTNSKLGDLNSNNLPQKTNFKNYKGLDAMTGKSNFDIAEYITTKMIETFQNLNGNIALLVKNSVIKNILFDQYKNKHAISKIEKHCIDSKKEFNVSVEASLFCCKLNSNPEFECNEFNFYKNDSPYRKFGWLNTKFVSNIDTYKKNQNIDGESPFVWRQGIKHDCSAIMELTKVEGHYVNGINEKIKLEDGLVYGMLKSSDLKHGVINQPRKYTIVTQRKVGQETNYIKSEFPKTFQYLTDHQKIFTSRKSSIYNNKPMFSIFGIGDYSFKPYKVAISGLYKTCHFTLISPQFGKPVMLDDTCYFIGFDNLEFAVYTFILLNSDITMQFLRSITFSDAKRTFTKDVLMRIDLCKLTKLINRKVLKSELDRFCNAYQFSISLNKWDQFIKLISHTSTTQLTLFA